MKQIKTKLELLQIAIKDYLKGEDISKFAPPNKKISILINAIKTNQYDTFKKFNEYLKK